MGQVLATFIGLKGGIIVKDIENIKSRFPVSATSGFVIGNGESRKGFDLNSLSGKGPIFGCNALYRDFEPDVLCALDHKVLLELSNNEYKGVIGKLNKTFSQANLGAVYLEFLNVPRGKGVAWYSGIFATWLLASTAPLFDIELKRIFLIGFDLYDSKTNNVYKNSNNYERMGMNDKIQFENFKNLIFTKFPEITFLRVVKDPSVSTLPDEWILLDNIRNISYTDLGGYL